MILLGLLLRLNYVLTSHIFWYNWRLRCFNVLNGWFRRFNVIRWRWYYLCSFLRWLYLILCLSRGNKLLILFWRFLSYLRLGNQIFLRNRWWSNFLLCFQWICLLHLLFLKRIFLLRRILIDCINRLSLSLIEDISFL